MKRPEILAPAGNMECLKAAIIAGADAIYIGGYMFGARAFSNNFSNEELVEAINYAHMYNVKIYVTANTIIYENEVDRFIDYIEFLYNNNVDAVIIQDIGMMDLVRQTFPNLEVHASTQMHIHNLEGVKLVEKLGLTRAVLARETTYEDIKNIKENTNIELEIFVHGALCISYSGQCLMSSLIGGRSGNRGTCAGSCRQKYNVLDNKKNKVNTEEYNLSTKDLNSLDNIGKLIEIGVDSLKIEGRMKSPEYVYLVVSLYRKAVDSYLKDKTINITTEDITNLKKIFNRMFTKGFMFNELNENFINPFRPNHQGIEIGKVISTTNTSVIIKLTEELNINDGIRIVGKEDSGWIVTSMFVNGQRVTCAPKGETVYVSYKGEVENGSIVLKTTDYALNKEVDNLLKTQKRRIEITGKIILKENDLILLEVTDGINNISVNSDMPVEKASNNPTSKERVLEQLTKTGSTVFEFTKLDIQMDDNLFISIKEINELRRIALEKLAEVRKDKMTINERKIYKREVPSFSKQFNKNIYIKTQNQYDKIKNGNYTYIYADLDLYNKIKDNRLILKLPRVITKHEEYNNPLLVGELGSVNKYKNIHTDFSLNVVNSYSIALLHNLGVKQITISYELDDNQIKEMISGYKKRYKENPNLEMIVYAKEEIMISKFNLLKYYKLNSNGYLEDRFNNLYKVVEDNDLMYIYNYMPKHLNNLNYYSDLGINNFRYNIVDEEDLNNII